MSTQTQRPATDELRSIGPSGLWEEWLTEKGGNKRQNTIDLVERTWGLFQQWFDTKEDMSTLAELGPYFPADFHKYIRNNTEQNKLTRFYQLTRLETVIQYGKGVGYIRPDVPYSWDKPELDKGDRQRSNPLRPERGVEIGQWVRLAHPFKAEHVLWTLAFNYGLRKSAIRAIDLDHVVLDPESGNPPHLIMRDRPDMDLPLKNTREELAERLIPLRSHTVDILRRYMDQNRIEHDDTGRPAGLITTKRSARISSNTIYRTLSKLTSPATYEDGQCDCDSCRDFRERHGTSCDCDWCDGYSAKENRPIPAQDRYKCDMSREPHAIRHGAITHMLKKEIPIETISHIVGTSPVTIRDTYDRRTDSERMNAIADGWVDD